MEHPDVRLLYPRNQDWSGALAGTLSAGTWRRVQGVGTEAREEDVEGGMRSVERAMTGTG